MRESLFYHLLSTQLFSLVLGLQARRIYLSLREHCTHLRHEAMLRKYFLRLEKTGFLGSVLFSAGHLRCFPLWLPPMARQEQSLDIVRLLCTVTYNFPPPLSDILKSPTWPRCVGWYHGQASCGQASDGTRAWRHRVLTARLYPTGHLSSLIFPIVSSFILQFFIKMLTISPDGMAMCIMVIIFGGFGSFSKLSAFIFPVSYGV